MAWLETFSSALGVGTGGATLAVAIYTGSVALENNMRDDAKQEIADFINYNPKISNSQTVANFIRHAFEVIFGPKHFSVRCITRSIMATLTFLLVIGSFFLLKYPAFPRTLFTPADVDPFWDIILDIIVIIVIIPILSLIPDYISLFKGRLMLRIAANRPTIPKTIVLAVTDVLLSLAISIACLAIIAGSVASMANITLQDFLDYLYGDLFMVVFFDKNPKNLDAIGGDIIAVTTMMTSIWALLVMVSCVLLKVLGSLSPFMRLIRWMFDVDAHPVRVLGLVAGALVWVGSVVYGLV